MFCSKCGKQIPDNTKFCNHCGAEQKIIKNTDSAPKTTQNQQKTAEIPNQQPKKETKKANVIIILAVVLGCFLLGKFVIAPSFLSDSDKDNISNQGGQSQENNSGSSASSNNPAYQAIFDGTYIANLPPFFNMDMMSFAFKEDDGTIYCSDYGYKDDIVKQWVETVYIPISEYTDTQKKELENTKKAQLAKLETLNCCTVKYKMSTNYFTITCTFSDMDKPENYSKLYAEKLLSENALISMSKTESNLLSKGYVKK